MYILKLTINLDCFVQSSFGEPINNLTHKSFQLFESSPKKFITELEPNWFGQSI